MVNRFDSGKRRFKVFPPGPGFINMKPAGVRDPSHVPLVSAGRARDLPALPPGNHGDL